MTDLAEQMLSLQAGDHLCLFYDKDPAEQMPALMPFIQDGLSKGERFIYVADDQTADELAGRLERAGINVGRETDRGTLRLWTRREWRQPGELSSEKKSQQVRKIIADAQAAGFQGVRFAVEMTWTLGPDISASKLEHWEATINRVFSPGVPSRIICQYNRSRLAPDVLLAALHTHPLAIFGEHVRENFFYEAPLILGGHANGDLNSKNGAAAKIEWMIDQLKRPRTAELEREALTAKRVALKQTHRAAEASEWLAAIIQSSDDAIIGKDLNGIVTSWNHGAERLFGYTADEMIGKSITTLMPPDRVKEEAEILSRLRRGERIDHFETTRRRKDGSLVEISLTISPVRVEGRIVGASKIARDITAWKHSERELREAKEQLSLANQELEKRVQERTASLREAIAQMEEFSYSVSHDLRAPVRAMQGYAKATLADYGDKLDDVGRDFLGRIIRGGARMDRLIQDLLAYCRLTRSQIELQPISLNKLAREIIHQYPEMQPPRSDIWVQDDLGYVMAHEVSLRQVVYNLLSNAVKFVAPGTLPKVRLWTEPRGEFVRLWVQDNGIGLAPEHQRRLFGLFERIHPENRFEGTGVGLAIVRKSVERMGGRVGVESDGVNGSRFWIELPAAPTRESANEIQPQRELCAA